MVSCTKQVFNIFQEQEAMGFFLRSNLDMPTIQKIWLIADFERDRTLDRDEFVIAFHLIRLKRKHPNMPIPHQCPPELVPGNKRVGSPAPFQQPQQHGFGQTMQPNFPMGSSPTFQQGIVRPPSTTNFAPIQNVPNFQQPNINVRQVEMQVNQLLDQSRMMDEQLFPARQQNELARQQMEQLRLQHSELELKIANQKQDFEKAQQERNQLNQEQANLRSKIEVLGHESQGMQMQIQSLKQEILRLEGLKDRASEEDNRQTGIMSAVQTELQQVVQQFVTVREDLVATLNRQNEFTGQKDVQEREVAAKRQELLDLKKQLTDKQSNIQKIESEISILQATKRELENSAHNVNTSLHDLDNEYAHLTQQLQDMQVIVQEQQQKGGSNAKLYKLREILNKAHQFVEEYYRTVEQDFPANSAQSPRSPRNVHSPHMNTGFDDFHVEEFKPAVIPKQSSPQKTPSSPPVKKPTPTFEPVRANSVTSPASQFDDDEFHADFGDDDFGGHDTAPKAQTKSPPPIVAPTQQTDDWGFESPKPKQKDAFDDFTQTNSNNTSDAAWADDFGW
jgi:predicted  nucleic acid-binding Zn-ribbon protein